MSSYLIKKANDLLVQKLNDIHYGKNKSHPERMAFYAYLTNLSKVHRAKIYDQVQSQFTKIHIQK